MANFNKGGQSAKEAVKEQSTRTSFHRTQFLGALLKEDGNSEVIRLIDDHDEWIWIHQHEFVPTKGAPETYAGNTWPKGMRAVCRKAKTKEGDLVFPEFGGECFICDEMTGNKFRKDSKYVPSIKVWARAVLREEIVGTKELAAEGLCEDWQVGKPFTYIDKEVEIDVLDDEGKPTGDKKSIPEVVFVNFAMGNFFGKFQALADAYGTVLDRDYKVLREGKGKDTEYQVIALEPVAAVDEEGNSNGRKWTLEDPKVRAPYEALVDLEAEIERHASDDHFDTFFDTTRPFPERWDKSDDDEDEAPKKSAPKTASKAAAKASAPEPEADAAPATAQAEKMKAMKARLLKAGATASAE